MDESEDEDEDAVDNQPFQIDYLCIASPPSLMDSLMDVEALSIEKEELSNSGMVGYTLCGDNIDKNVRRRYQRSDRTTISLHHFHMYAVKNRVDFTLESDDCLYSNLSVDDKACLVMPSLDDDQLLKKNISIIISRELTNHMEFFKFGFTDVVCWHNYKAQIL